MGKGGTKFEENAIGHRSGRSGGMVSGKEARKNMEQFLATGYHPGVEENVGICEPEIAAFEDGGRLPARNAHRPHAFMSVQCTKDYIGHLQFELFDDINPIATRVFRVLCNGTGTDGVTKGACYRGQSFFRVLPGRMVEAGRMEGPGDSKAGTSASQGEKRETPGRSSVSHAAGGVVSVGLTGTQFMITVNSAPEFDSQWIPVGRVVGGHLVVSEIAAALEAHVKNEALPLPRILDCGPLANAGLSDTAMTQMFEARMASQAAEREMQASLKDETPAQTKARLQEEAKKRKCEVQEALKLGFSEANKRTKAAEVKKPVWQGALGDDFSDSSEDSEDGDT